MESGEHENSNGIGPNSLDKERNMVNDDPKWQGMVWIFFVPTSFIYCNNLE